ncbi:SLC13 family permease [Alkalimonas amylolytica]|uniref:Solute carrier family 13 (Sodium-dependent dicarboxylate transporter), member 2/3/5 n=1 Tax=Alkalimonas amylolytica TaxID=152573 RepID=A0A1H3ZRP6_ALKAM|nr:DASS family sodium-coupled anion symporter [Alkalimonas amylolytica]SEA26328.1 solute carrier family 13 (sodium-dependent dicarboxylate transporter), member 2/3/5 [Alkalimonas amylolytica]
MATKKPTYLFALLAGPLSFVLLSSMEVPFDDMSQHAWLMAALTLWMAIWWISEAVPIPVTSLLPIILVPLLRLDSLGAVTAPYAHPLIFLFLGGFLLSIAMERWQLHKRIALHVMLIVGSKPSQQVAGLMFVTAFLSMWMSNTATSVMMLPIALSVLALQQNQTNDNSGFDTAVMLAIAYSASIGGVATLIGTPPNALLAAYLQSNYDIQIGFARWMLIGVPIASLMLVLCWFWLTKLSFQLDKVTLSDTKDLYRDELQQLGPMSDGEKRVLAIFLFAAIGWISREFVQGQTGWPLDDTIIAIIAACLLFIVPVNWRSGQRILQWEDTKKLPWGILLLFGGGLALAGQIQKSGLADFIALQVGGLDGISILLLVLLVTSIIVFLTEVTSNTATAAGFLPLLGPVALALDTSVAMLVVPAALAASCAFMMPVATPPNAIVFASGKLKIIDMVKAGFALNIMAIAVITLFCYWLVELIFSF